MLTQFRLGERQCQVGAVDRDVVAELEQVGDGADVVLVSVGEHHAHDVFEAVLDPREVGEDEVDAGLVDLGEKDAAVDDEQLPVAFEDVHIASDLAQAAQWDDTQRAVLEGLGRGQVFVQRLHDSKCATPRRRPGSQRPS